MKVKRYDGRDVKRVVAGMVMDPVVCAKISSHWPREGLFGSSGENLIGKWCVDYFRKYDRPPGKDILPIYESWAASRNGNDTATTTMVERLLQEVNRVYEQEDQVQSSDYLLDLAGKVFNGVRLRKAWESIEGDLDAHDVDAARKKMSEVRLVELDGEVESAAEIEPKPVLWLWRDWLARGEFAMFDGHPGVGKSQLLLDIATRVSRGWKMPPADLGVEWCDPHTVIILSAEDSWPHTIVPRLSLAKADLKMIIPLRESTIFPQDLPKVERIVREHKTRLIIIDPITAFLGSVDSNAETQVRGVLTPIRKMIERTGVTVAMIRHFKKEKASAIHRGGGSTAWTATCRLQHVIGRDPNADKKFVLANSKSNLAPNPKSLAYQIVGGDVPGKRERIETSMIEWLGETDVTADDVASPATVRGRPDKSSEAVELIEDLLHDGPMDSKELASRVRGKLSIGESTYRKARKEAGVQMKKDGFGLNSKWMCTLDDD